MKTSERQDDARTQDLPPGHPSRVEARNIMEQQHEAPGYVAPWNLAPATGEEGKADIRIGVLALQGAFREHILHFQALGVVATEVKNPQDLQNIDGLAIPGGESTAMVLIAERQGMLPPLQDWVKRGRPTWGTCAGMILLAKEIEEGAKDTGQSTLEGMDICVSRNYFGRQAQSFEAELSCPAVRSATGPDASCQAIFIRAPCIMQTKPGVEVLARLSAARNPRGEEVVVAARQGPLLACAFHPELTSDRRWHEYFVEMVTSCM